MLDDAVLLLVRRALEDKPLLVEGANGALGLSIAVVLLEQKIFPSAILLTTKQSDLSAEWSALNCETTLLKSTAASFMDERARWISSQPQGIFVIYAAGYGRPNFFLSDHESILSANIHGLLGYANWKNIEYFAYVSTSEIYTGCDGVAYEDSVTVSTPLHPRAVYIEAKRLSEALVHHVISETAQRAVIYRVALAIPPKMLVADNRVLADLLRAAIDDGKVTLHGGGNLVRQYQYGPNAIYKLLGSMVNGKANTYNNAGSHVYKLADLARLIAELFNAELEIQHANMDDSSPKAVLLSTSLIDTESRYLQGRELSLRDYLTRICSNET